MAGSSQAQKLHVRHDIFLSHSGQDKAFVEQLYHDLKRVNHHPFFDQSSYSLPKAEKFAPAIFEAAEQCRLGVVVVSEGYLTSKWPMLELSKFVESKKTSNPELRLLPLFFRLSPGDLKQEEVDTKWTPSWRQLVERGKVKEEVVELWSEAVKELRRHNGLEYGKFANSEYKYRSAVVAKICKRLPPILRWNTDHIQGYERLCKMASSMFNAEVVDGDNKVCKYLGLYGMGGVGKTTLCKALCSYFQGEFRGRVCHVELTSDQGNERLASAERLACLKRVVQQLAAFEKSVPQGISSEEQGWECLKNGLRNQAPIFLAIDNVGDSESSREEAQSYLNAGLPSGSKVLVTSRSQEILENVLGRAEYCKPIPRLEHDEAAKLFLSKAAPKKSSFNDEESEIVERCLKECQFTDNGYTSTQYHPLILRALGTYFHDVHSVDVLSWEEALENKNKLQRSREAKHVNDILGLNYRSLSDQEKLVFLDTALYPYHGYAPLPWWSKGKRSDYDLWVSWIYEAHGVSPLDARMMLEKLQRLSLLEVSSLEEPYAHDLYKEFARVLVEQEGSKEWEWWMSREELGSGNVPQLKRLVLEKDKSLIGRPPRKFQEWRSLVFLELIQCDNIGPVLELEGLNNLTVLALYKCANLKRILSSCSNGCNDQIFCYKGKPGQGCMSELRSVKLQRLSVLEDIPFLRHCSDLETLRILDCNRAIYPTTSVDSESRAAIDLEYLKALRTLSVSEGWNFNILGYDIGAFITWLLAAVRLQMLTAFEYQSHEPVGVEEAMVEVDERLGGYTIDLNEVGHLSSELSVLSLRLPWQIVEMKGLHLLSKLTTLNLNWCRGLRQLPDLRGLPKLKRMCVHGCCRLEALPCLGAGVQEIGDFFPTGYLSLNHDYQGKVWTSHECLRPYCKETNCQICRKRTEDESEGSSVCFRPNFGSEHSKHGLVMNTIWLRHSGAEKRIISDGEFRNLNNGPSSYDKMKMVEVTLLAKKIAQQYQRQGASSKSNSPTPCISLPRPDCVAPATMNREKLMKMANAVRIGGKGSIRRKNKTVHKTTAADDKRLQNTLKRLGVNTIPGIEEVNIFKDETVIHFVNPKVQASLAANTCVVSGPSQTKKLEELLPSIINQLGPDNLVALRKIDQQYQSQAAAGTRMFLTL